MFKFIHSADIHLDSPMHMLARYEGAPVGEVRGATRGALENLVDLAMGEKADFLLICGDLYDGDWRDYNTGLFFISQMAKLHEEGIPVFIIAGNHDAANRMTKTLRLPEGVQLLRASEPVTLALDHVGVAIHGQSFTSQAVYSDLSEKYPDALPGLYNIGMLHTCANGRPGHDRYAPCKIQGLRLKEYDYWALGHIHKREILSEDPLIIFPGNLQGRHIGERGSKGCMLVTVDEKGFSSPEFRPLDIVRWEQCEVDVSGMSSDSAFFDGVLDELTRICGTTDLPLIVRLYLIGECPAHEQISSDMERIVNEIRSESITLSGGRIWIEKIILETAPPANAATLATTGPVAELLGLIGELTSDPEYLQRAGDSLCELWSKLPKEVRDCEEAISPDDPNGLNKLIGEVPTLLLRRLKNLQ